MSLTVLALVLAAAFAHAGWNFLAKGAEGGVGFVWLATLASAVLYLPVLAFASGEDVGWQALGLMFGSGALHALYFVLLQRGYATGDLSLVYPLARGTGPLLSTMVAILVLGERPSALAIVGAAIIIGSVFSLVARTDGGSAMGTARDATTFALLTGVAIAGYTLWDKHAVDGAGLDPLVYYWGTNAFNLLLISAWVARRWGGVPRAWQHSPLASGGRRRAQPARLHPRALRAPAGAGQLRRPGAGDEHPPGDAAGHDRAGGGGHHAPAAGGGRDRARRHRSGAWVNVKVNCGWVGQ